MRVALGWACALLLAHPAGGRQGAPTEVAFEATLKRVHALMEVGRWSTAKDLLQGALAEHTGGAYVVRRLAEMREDLARCAFGMHHTPPEAGDVVAGEVLAYRPARGDVHLRYRAEKDAGRSGAAYSTFLAPGDFVEDERGNVWVHPLVWNGPHTVRVRGRALAQKRILGIVPCASESEGYSLALSATAAGLYRVSEEGTELLTEIVPIEASGPYVLEIQVGTNEVRVLLDGRSILRAEKPRQLYGAVGFTHFADIEEVTFEGRAELSWIQRKIDARNELARLAFDASYDVVEDLPAWLAAFQADAQSSTEDSAFAGFGSDAEAALSRAEAFDAKQDYEGGLAFARALPEDDVPEAVRAWLACHFLAALERPGEALPLARDTARLAPRFFPGRRKYVELVRQTGSQGGWAVEARALIAAFPDRAEPYEDLARALLLEGDRAGVRSVLQDALARGLRSHRLQLVDELLARAARGPGWARAFEVSSNHYDVHSDISRELCLEAAQVLDTAYQRYSMRLGRIPAHRQERFPVYLFSGEAGYLTYSSNLLGYLPIHTAGVYSPALQQLLVWNLPQREQMLATIRHEGFHQYLDQLVGPAPTWLHEGLAEYFELSRLERGHWTDGAPSPVHLAALGGAAFEWSELGHLLRMESADFYQNAPANYAQAWLLVHFLEHSSVRNKRRIPALVNALGSGVGNHAALEQAFPPSELPELERAWRAHLDGLL